MTGMLDFFLVFHLLSSGMSLKENDHLVSHLFLGTSERMLILLCVHCTGVCKCSAPKVHYQWKLHQVP